MIKAVFYFEDGAVTIHSEPTTDVRKNFTSGYYRASKDGQGKLYIDKLTFKEVHEPYPNQNAKVILDAVSKFLNSKNHTSCNEMDYVYKMNTLLYGVQGSGKTALMQFIANRLIEEFDAIVFRVDGPHNVDHVWSLCEGIREVQKNPIIIIMDEFETFCAKKGESYIKQILDGNRSIDYSMVLGATNHLIEIPPTIKDRPSRFLLVAEIRAIEDREVVKDLVDTIHNKVKKPFLDEDQKKELIDTLMEDGSLTVDKIKNKMLSTLMGLTMELDNPSSGIRIGRRSESPEKVLSINEQLDALKGGLDNIKNEVNGTLPDKSKVHEDVSWASLPEKGSNMVFIDEDGNVLPDDHPSYFNDDEPELPVLDGT